MCEREAHACTYNCLVCANSFPDEDEYGNSILRCVEHGSAIVEPDDPVCVDFH